MRRLSHSRKVAIHLLAVLALSILLVPASTAQPTSLEVRAASISINPAATDSYTLQGTVSGLSLTGASYVWLSVGNFGAGFPLSFFTQQPGTNIFMYQDSTGRAPGWISSLTLDLDAKTFIAEANSMVLSGLSNPFAVHLGTDQGSACTMVRLQQASVGSYQLTPADQLGMTCEISNTPLAIPNVVPVGTSTSVTVNITPIQLSANDTPQNLQLFRADGNAQPTGNALCTLNSSAAGDYACTLSFNEANPGMVPLVITGTASGQPVLSPGFALQVVAPATDADMQQLANIEKAMTQGWQNLSQYGDSAFARVQILKQLRALLAPPAALTTTPVGLALDGLSIYVRSNAGLPVVLPSNDVTDVLAAAATSQASPAAPAALDAALNQREIIQHPHTAASPSGSNASLACGDFQRDIVSNNEVLVWSPGDIFFKGNNYYPLIVQELQNSKCPSFSKPTTVLGSQATVASLNSFPSYGTIIMNTHGFLDQDWVGLITGEASPTKTDQLTGIVGVQGVACVPQGCFKTVYPNNPNIHALKNTVIYGGFCYSFLGGDWETIYEDLGASGERPILVHSPGLTGYGFREAFAPAGSNSAYYGYLQVSSTLDDKSYGVPLFDSLLSQYKSTGEAYSDVIPSNQGKSILAPSFALVHSGEAASTPSSPGIWIGGRDVHMLPIPPPTLHFPPHFGIWNDTNLAYVGNPHLTLTNLSPPVPGSQGLAAYLEGAASCGTDNSSSYLNVHWTNTATVGHLKSVTSLISGSQDDFYNQATEDPPESTEGTLVSDWALAKYTPDPSLAGVSDNVIADFYPDLGNPVAARACLTVQGKAGLFVSSQLAAVYNEADPQIPPPQTFSPPQKIIGSYTVPLSDPGGYTQLGASASVTVTPNGPGNWTVVVEAGGDKPTTAVNVGPYDGKASIILLAINPPSSSATSSVTITGKLNITPVCQSANVCAFPDGHMTIGDSNDNIVANMSLYPGDNPVTPFSYKADSTKSAIPQGYPVAIAVGITSISPISTPASFSATLQIQFSN